MKVTDRFTAELTGRQFPNSNFSAMPLIVSEKITPVMESLCDIEVKIKANWGFYCRAPALEIEKVRSNAIDAFKHDIYNEIRGIVFQLERAVLNHDYAECGYLLERLKNEVL